MIKMIKHDFSLKSLNTFGLDVKADRYFSFTNIDELKDFIQDPKIDLKVAVIFFSQRIILDWCFIQILTLSKR